jgi:NAD(P)-dependent dehydrogenase (short-subunit alcohol dehydrogenase family)
MDLTGRRILVTGASSGIGAACAVVASRLGAGVVLVGRREEALRATLGQMDEPGRHAVCPFDLAEAGRVEELFKAAAAGGKLDGVVHSAGICPAAPAALQSLAELQEALVVNYLSFMAMARCFSKRAYMERGSVVAVSSVSAEAGWAGGSAYAGTKGALCASVRSLAIELAPKRIRVNAVLPSNIKTPMFDALAGDLNDEAGLAALRQKQPLGLGAPEDVAHAVCFLLSDAAGFITGASLAVDGGYLAQ